MAQTKEFFMAVHNRLKDRDFVKRVRKSLAKAIHIKETPPPLKKCSVDGTAIEAVKDFLSIQYEVAKGYRPILWVGEDGDLACSNFIPKYKQAVRILKAPSLKGFALNRAGGNSIHCFKKIAEKGKINYAKYFYKTLPRKEMTPTEEAVRRLVEDFAEERGVKPLPTFYGIGLISGVCGKSLYQIHIGTTNMGLYLVKQMRSVSLLGLWKFAIIFGLSVEYFQLMVKSLYNYHPELEKLRKEEEPKKKSEKKPSKRSRKKKDEETKD